MSIINELPGKLSDIKIETDDGNVLNNNYEAKIIFDTAKIPKETIIVPNRSGNASNYVSPYAVYEDSMYMATGQKLYKYYKQKGWKIVSTTPINSSTSTLVVYNNYLYMLNSGSTMYRYNGSTWTNVGVTTPAYISNSTAVVFNNQIHVFGSNVYDYMRYHWTYSGTTWSTSGSIPIGLYNIYGKVVLYNNYIYILGGYSDGSSTSVYRSSNTAASSWTLIGNMPIGSGYAAVVFNDHIHVFGGSATNYAYHYYSANGSSWTKLNDIVQPCASAPALIWDDEIYIFGGSNYIPMIAVNSNSSRLIMIGDEIENLNEDIEYQSEYYLTSGGDTNYRYAISYHGSIYYIYINKIIATDGSSSYTIANSSLTLSRIYDPIVYNDEIYVFGYYGSAYGLYKWIDATYSTSTSAYISASDLIVGWKQVVSLGSSSVTFDTAVIYNNSICYAVGKNIYSFNFATGVTLLCATPITIYKMIVHNNEIHVFSSTTDHYKFSLDSGWSQASTLPYTCNASSFISYNGKIHMYGGTSTDLNYYKHYVWDGTSWLSFDNVSIVISDAKILLHDDSIYIAVNSNLYRMYKSINPIKYLSEHDGIHVTLVAK